MEEAHDALGLTYRQIAAAIGADESTLWRRGSSACWISTRPGCLERHGLTEALPATDDWRARQDAARRARDGGCQAILFPSVTGSGENLAVFSRPPAGWFIRTLREREIRP